MLWNVTFVMNKKKIMTNVRKQLNNVMKQKILACHTYFGLVNFTSSDNFQ